MSRRAVLLADVGGTYARFALAAPGERPKRVAMAMTAGFATFEDAVRDVLARHGGGLELAGAAVAGAGPVVGGAIRMTNAGWTIGRDGLREAARVDDVHVVNDFTAAALSLPALVPDDLVQIGGGAGDARSPRAVLGPGTGLGISGLVPDGRGGHIALSGEGGHADLPPAGDRELAIVHSLQRSFGRASIERVLSGPGLENLYMAIAGLDGAAVAARPAPVDIAARARAGSDPVAAETVQRFCGWLGAVAGNLALTLGARGGVYVTGGIVPAWGDLFDAALFRRRFEAKGRMTSWLEPIPCFVVHAQDVNLIGLAQLFAKDAG